MLSRQQECSNDLHFFQYHPREYYSISLFDLSTKFRFLNSLFPSTLLFVLRYIDCKNSAATRQPLRELPGDVGFQELRYSLRVNARASRWHPSEFHFLRSEFQRAS